MPSNNNLHVDDVKKLLSDAERFIDKWFNDTVDLFKSKVKSNKPVDHLCITSLTVSITYVKAIRILVSAGGGFLTRISQVIGDRRTGI